MEKTDVIIIGGGILGACIGYHLIKEGIEVILLERDEVATGASGANFGMLSLYERAEPWHWPMVFDSLNFFRKMQDQVDIGLDHCGGTIAVQDDSELARALHLFAPLENTPVQFTTYLRKELSRIEPNLQVYGGIHFPQEEKLNPLRTTLTIMDWARDAGLTLYLNRGVKGFRTNGKRITEVQTEQGLFRGRWVVNAAGSWADSIAKLLGQTNPVRYHRGTAMVSQPVPPLIKGTVVGGFLNRENYAGPDSSVVCAAAQSAEGSVLIAQATQPSDLEDWKSSRVGLERIARKSLDFFPDLGSLDIIRSWAAVTPYTDDGLPVYGFHRDVENLLTVAGFRGAFSTAPAVGREVARTLQGLDSFLMQDSFSPDRNATL